MGHWDKELVPILTVKAYNEIGHRNRERVPILTVKACNVFALQWEDALLTGY